MSISNTSKLTDEISVPDSHATGGKYCWEADLVWRNRSFKDLHVFFDQDAGIFGFSKSKSDTAIYSSNSNEFFIYLDNF